MPAAAVNIVCGGGWMNVQWAVTRPLQSAEALPAAVVGASSYPPATAAGTAVQIHGACSAGGGVSPLAGQRRQLCSDGSGGAFCCGTHAYRCPRTSRLAGELKVRGHQGGTSLPAAMPHVAEHEQACGRLLRASAQLLPGLHSDRSVCSVVQRYTPPCCSHLCCCSWAACQMSFCTARSPPLRSATRCWPGSS